MREIKFRAWDTENEVMLHGEDIAWVTLATLEEEHSNHYMQYTGLKDKNGTEIYEGDIIQYHWEDGEADKPEVVEWEAPIFTVDSDTAYDASRLTLHNNYEIIGNIYEAPDLLNSDQPTSEHEAKTKASHD